MDKTNMNDKAIQWLEHMEKFNMMDWFQVEKVEDEMHTVLFRTVVAVNGEEIPVMLQTDDSLCTMLMVLINQGGVNDGNRARLVELANKYNSEYKIFKYIVSENRVESHSFIFGKDEDFDPETIHVLIESVAKNMEETYGEWIASIFINR